MATVKQCDKCKKVYDDETTDFGADKVPDLVVSLDGDVILQYKDLCPGCKGRCADITEKNLAVTTRRRRGTTDSVSEKTSES